MNKKKVVGITTLWGTPVNYGQILQAFALTCFIQNLGFDTFILRYQDSNIRDSICMKIKRILTGQKSIRMILKRYTCKHEQTANRGFKEFGEKHLNFTDIVYSSFDELCKTFPHADYFVTGSDQVWGEYGSTDKKKVYLLDFLPASVKKISYAASFGRNKLNDDEIELFSQALRKFSTIGVREKSGVDICKSLGIYNCKWVLDPTLLFSKEEWFKVLNIKYNKTIENIALFYILTNDGNNRKIYRIANYLRKSGYTIKYVSSSYYLDKKANYNPTIQEWLSTLNSASIVITNSYHGTIFSLICNTPFFFLSKSESAEGQNSRIYSVLNQTGLSDRIINRYNLREIRNKLELRIDWDYVNKNLNYQKDDSVNFLRQALEPV